MTEEIKKTILIFGSLSVVIMLLFQLEKWSLFAFGTSDNLYLIISGILFLILGIVISKYFHIKSVALKRKFRISNLSEQEMRVLILIADGLSNKEIADRLFIAETTVKSHVSNILTKLNAKRRTEAIKRANELGII